MKRSRSIALVMMGASSIVLTACDEPQVDAYLFRDVEQCVDQPGASRAACEEAYGVASGQHASVAPKYASKADCEADFGAGQCETAPYQTDSGGSVFMPLMMGYMMGSMLGRGSGAAPQPLYRTAADPSAFRTADNRSAGATTGATRVARAATVPPTAKAYTVARGGFGAGAGTYGSARS
ncbi:MAG: DUF1190 domain-containing protein [Rhodospirillales bacterium]